MRRTLALNACLALVACAPTIAQTRGGDAGDNGDAARRAAASRIVPGDRVVVIVAGEPRLSDTVAVNERGEAAFQKLGVVNVSAFSIGQLRDSLRVRYETYLLHPALEITVLRRVAVNGEVRSPNVYMVDISTTLRDVIARAGGFTNEANRDRVYLVRGSARTRVVGWEQETSAASDLRSGDQVIVGRKSWWALNALSAVTTGVLVISLIVSLTNK